MNQERNIAEKEDAGRKPGQRPDGREREELLFRVERAVAQGLRTPAEVLHAVPELGTWDTARSYLDECHARWREAAGKEALREARGEMVAALRYARERLMAALPLAGTPAEVARLAREVERLVRCEAWLLGLDPAALDRPEAEPETPDDEPLSIRDEIEYLQWRVEDSPDEASREEFREFIRSVEAELAADADGENRENPSPARMDPSNPTETGAGEEIIRR